MERTTRDPGWRMSRVGTTLMGVLLIALGACGKPAEQPPQKSNLSDDLVGTWFAYRDNVIENMWTFRKDGTCINDGWPSARVLSGAPALPYHLEGAYRVGDDRITVTFALESGEHDTVVLYEPDITRNRLVYSVGDAPVVYLRERTAVGHEMAAAADSGAIDPELPHKLVGSWVALTDGFPVNTWKFNADGTFENEGWSRMNPRMLLVRRLYQVTGRYDVSGQRVVLANERVLQFDPETNKVDVEVPISERIVLYNVVISKGRLVYTNEVGLPVAFRPGVVSPTHW